MKVIDKNYPKRKFWDQRQSARHRKIEWKLSFDEWWDIWQASGKWEERGVRKGQYCMSRIGDCGPYSVNNVFIQLHSNNVKDANLGICNKKKRSCYSVLKDEEMVAIRDECVNLSPFPYGTKMKWLGKIATQYKITVSNAEKISSGKFVLSSK